MSRKNWRAGDARTMEMGADGEGKILTTEGTEAHRESAEGGTTEAPRAQKAMKGDMGGVDVDQVDEMAMD
jgi:hypothetical protein